MSSSFNERDRLGDELRALDTAKLASESEQAKESNLAAAFAAFDRAQPNLGPSSRWRLVGRIAFFAAAALVIAMTAAWRLGWLSTTPSPNSGAHSPDLVKGPETMPWEETEQIERRLLRIAARAEALEELLASREAESVPRSAPAPESDEEVQAREIIAFQRLALLERSEARSSQNEHLRARYVELARTYPGTPVARRAEERLESWPRKEGR